MSDQRRPTPAEHEAAVAGAVPRSRRRNTELGDQACFCTSCGWARRFYPGVIEPPVECPDCAAPVCSSCPDCGESILSVMAVDCDACGAPLRERALGSGLPIRRSPRA